jgi:hypothetical protein
VTSRTALLEEEEEEEEEEERCHNRTFNVDEYVRCFVDHHEAGLECMIENGMNYYTRID